MSRVLTLSLLRLTAQLLRGGYRPCKEFFLLDFADQFMISATGHLISIRAGSIQCLKSSVAGCTYCKRCLGCSKGISMPATVDIPTGAVVTNDFA